MLEYLSAHPDVYRKTGDMSHTAGETIRKKTGLTVHTLGSMFTVFYTGKPVTDFSDALTQDLSLFRKVFSRLLNENILLPPSAFETSFISAAHTASDVRKLAEVFCAAVR